MLRQKMLNLGSCNSTTLTIDRCCKWFCLVSTMCSLLWPRSHLKMWLCTAQMDGTALRKSVPLLSSVSILTFEQSRAFKFWSKRTGCRLVTCSANDLACVVRLTQVTEVRYLFSFLIVFTSFGIRCRLFLNSTLICFCSLRKAFTPVSTAHFCWTIHRKDSRWIPKI